MRRLLEFGPSAAFYLFALAAQVSGYVSPASALVLAVIATLLLFVPACHHSHAWHRARKSDGRNGLDSWYFIAPCLVVAILAIAGAAYGFGLRASASQEEPNKAAPAQSVSPTREEFLKNATVIIGFGADQPPIAFGGTSTLTTERLRVFVDYSIYRSGWMMRVRLPIGEIKDPVKGEYVRIPLAYRGSKPNGGAEDVWWGSDPSPSHPVSNPVFGQIPVSLTRGRIVVIGPSNKEQYVYFELLRVANDPTNGEFRFMILQGRDVYDWIAHWEAE